MIYESELGVDGFLGLKSNTAFDAVTILDPVDNAVHIDDLYFGVPAPFTMLPVVAGVLFVNRSRHRR
jgi:hypothetical protein